MERVDAVGGEQGLELVAELAGGLAGKVRGRLIGEGEDIEDAGAVADEADKRGLAGLLVAYVGSLRCRENAGDVGRQRAGGGQQDREGFRQGGGEGGGNVDLGGAHGS